MIYSIIHRFKAFIGVSTMIEKKQRLGAGRVAFLARKEEIKTKIDAGYTMITVYEEHQNQLGISYGQFVNYVNKFIKNKPKGKPAEEGKIKPEPNDDRPRFKPSTPKIDDLV